MKRPRQASRDSLLAAAIEVFSEKGFSGARVDEIAHKARANKAMIYYHFGTKEKLYQAVVMALFSGVLAELERLGREVDDPCERLLGFYCGLVRMAGQQPVLPRLMMREVLAGGQHLGTDTARVFGAIPGFGRTAIDEGVPRGQLQPANPLLVHFSLIGPILLYFISEPFRVRRLAGAIPALPAPTPAELVEHIRSLGT